MSTISERVKGRGRVVAQGLNETRKSESLLANPKESKACDDGGTTTTPPILLGRIEELYLTSTILGGILWVGHSMPKNTWRWKT